MLFLACTFISCCSIVNDQSSLLRSSFAVARIATWLLYHIRRSLSRGFEKLFSKSFRKSFSSRRGCSLPDSLLIIAHRTLFVKGVFQFFSNFLGKYTAFDCHSAGSGLYCRLSLMPGFPFGSLFRFPHPPTPFPLGRGSAR